VCACVDGGYVMVVPWSMCCEGAAEGDVCVCVGGGHVMVAMGGVARGCEGVYVLVAVV
jgi:hypothetical protein